MRLVVKKRIPQYGVSVLKNSEICDFIESHFSIEEALLTSKRNWLVLFVEWNLLSWLSYTSANFLSRTRTTTICDFATFWFGTFLVFLTPINGSASFAIGTSPSIRLHKCKSLRFGRDINIRSVIYPMGRPFCFRGKPNNVLPTLLIDQLVHVWAID